MSAVRSLLTGRHTGVFEGDGSSEVGTGQPAPADGATYDECKGKTWQQLIDDVPLGRSRRCGWSCVGSMNWSVMEYELVWRRSVGEGKDGGARGVDMGGGGGMKRDEALVSESGVGGGVRQPAPTLGNTLQVRRSQGSIACGWDAHCCLPGRPV